MNESLTPITDEATSHCVCNATSDPNVVPRSTAVVLEQALTAANAALDEAQPQRDDAIKRANEDRHRNIQFVNKLSELSSELQEAQRQGAEMWAALLQGSVAPHSETFRQMRDHALSTDCGYGYVRKEEVEKAQKEIAALRSAFAEASHNAGPAFVMHEEHKVLLAKAAELEREVEMITARAEAWEKSCQLAEERYGKVLSERDTALAKVTALEEALKCITTIQGADDCGGSTWQCAQIAKTALADSGDGGGKVDLATSAESAINS